MRHLLIMLVYFLTSAPTSVLAQSPSPVTVGDGSSPELPIKVDSRKEFQLSEFTISSKGGGGNYRYRIGDTLRIKVTGKAKTVLMEQLKNAEVSKILRLVLNDVNMSGLPVGIPQLGEGNDLVLSFHLIRRSLDDDNRKSWDALWAQWNSGFTMTLPVSLAIGNEPAKLVKADPGIELYVAEEATLFLTLFLCLVVFLVGYYLLVKSPTALRDTRGGIYSLGKSQMAFWGLLVMVSFSGIWVLTGTMERIPSQVLVLLGISGATGLSAVIIQENKRSTKNSDVEARIAKLRTERLELESEKSKSVTDVFLPEKENRLNEIIRETKMLSVDPPSLKSSGFWSDICDDGNGLSFHRMQVAIWTVVLGMVFIGTVIRSISMPEFSDSLLILQGVSSGTYLGFKFPEKMSV